MLERLAIIISSLRPRHIVFAGAAFGSVALAVWLWRAHRDAGPRLATFDCAQIYLGEGEPGAVVTGSWALTNAGRADLKFEVFSACDCGDISPAQGRIAPSETQNIHLSIKLGKRGERKGGYLTVQTNDPDNPMVSRYVFAECPAVLRVSPPCVNLDPVFAGEVKRVSCLLNLVDRKGQPLPKDSSIGIRWTSPFIRVDKELGSGNGLHLRVSCLPNTPPGELVDSLELRPANSQDAVIVPIRVRVLGQFTVVPSTLFLKTSARRQQYEEREILIWSLAGQRHLGRVLDVQTPKGISVAKIDSSGRGRIRLRVGGTDDGTWGPEGRIVVRCEGMDQPIVVNVVKPDESSVYEKP